MTRSAFLTLFLSLALFAKALVPTGWMPTGGKVFEITVCTGTDTHSLWLDRQGQLHKQDPTQQDGGSNSNSCAFAALAGAIDLPVVAQNALKPQKPSVAVPTSRPVAVIGKGLAAPPPPPTGPPLLT